METKREKLWSADYIKIMVSSLGSSFVIYFFASAFPMFAEKLTGTTVFGGLLVMAYALASLAARPLAGIISDKFGRVKLLVAGAVISGIACVLYGLTTNLILLFVVRAIHGFGYGVHTTCAGAVVADVVPKARLSEGVGYSGIWSTIAQAIGPWIALQIIGDSGDGNYMALFMASAGICLVSAVADCMLTYERKKRFAVAQAETSSATESEKTQQTDTLEQKNLPRTIFGFEFAVFAPAAVVLLLFFAAASINSFLILYAKWRGLSNIGLLFTFSAIGVFLSRFLFSRIGDKKGSDLVVIPGLIVNCICLLLIPFAKSLPVLACITFPLGIAQGAAMPYMQSIMFKRCSAQRRGTASAAYYAAADIGVAIGTPLWGFVVHLSSYNVMYWGASAALLAALILYIAIASDKVFYSKQQRESIKKSVG